MSETAQYMRVSEGLIVFYPFNERSGSVVADQSGFGQPMTRKSCALASAQSSKYSITILPTNTSSPSSSCSMANENALGKRQLELWNERVLYGTYKSKGYFYGSGVIEVGCKSVICQCAPKRQECSSHARALRMFSRSERHFTVDD